MRNVRFSSIRFAMFGLRNLQGQIRSAECFIRRYLTACIKLHAKSTGQLRPGLCRNLATWTFKNSCSLSMWSWHSRSVDRISAEHGSWLLFKDVDLDRKIETSPIVLTGTDTDPTSKFVNEGGKRKEPPGNWTPQLLSNNWVQYLGFVFCSMCRRFGSCPCTTLTTF